MPFPVAPAAIIAGGNILSRFLGKKFFGQGDILDPERFKKDLVLDDSDIGRIRGNILSRASQINAKNVAGIKQVGAAKRLPSGATQSAIAGASQNLGRGVASVEPQLQNLKRQSLMNFINLKLRTQGLTELQGRERAAFNQGTLGELGRIVTLWQAGFFDDDDDFDPQGKGGLIDQFDNQFNSGRQGILQNSSRGLFG